MIGAALTTDFSWIPTVPTIPFTRGVPGSFDMPSAYGSNYNAASMDVSSTGANVTQFGISMSADGVISYDGTNDGSDHAITGVILTVVDTITTAEADWQYRTGQAGNNPYAAGVVWYHDFRTDEEVNNFRWYSDSVKSFGNSPNASDPLVQACRRITSDGITGGCLEIVHPAGTSDPAMWWRPLTPMQGGSTTGNGRGAGKNDPAAAGTIPAEAWNPSNTQQTYNWGKNGLGGSTHGVYANAAYTGGQVNSTWNGTDFYVQIRTKMDSARIQFQQLNIGGKLHWFTHTGNSYTQQEIVVVNNVFDQTHNLVDAYQGYGYNNLNGVAGGNGAYTAQAGSSLIPTLGTCRYSPSANGGLNIQGCWWWSGGWDTLLYHLTPGTTGSVNQRLEIWAAHAGEHSYTKIWDQTYNMGAYDLDPGYAALILGTYSNGYQGYSAPVPFFHRHAQVIFSKQFIPCPQDNP